MMTFFKMILFFYLLFSINILADDSGTNGSGINSQCPNQLELIQEINNVTVTTTHTESGTVRDKKPNPKDKYDYYYFDVAVDGVVNLDYTSTKKTNLYFNLAADGCKNNKILNKGTSVQQSLAVTAGDRVYIAVRDKYRKKNYNNSYNIKLTFTPNTPTKRADLKISEINPPSPNPANIGDNITFWVRVNNLGPDTAKPNIVLSATYNQAVTIVSASQVGGGGDFTCSSSGSTITCTKTNNMIKNAPNKDFQFVVQASSAGTLTQTATVRSLTTNDPNINNNTISSSVTINSAPITANAVDDSFSISSGSTLSANVLTNDSGDGITVISNTQPSIGNVTIQADGTLTYSAPTVSGPTNVTFTYTIRDRYGNEDTATVTINITIKTQYTTNLGFELINPQNTRNIIGDYAIAGNTVLCLTNKTTGYWTENECSDTTSPGTRTSNNYVAAFIDIDRDNTTWNSSSSNITLPVTYDQQGGYGILWAGLIWQGRFAWANNNGVEDLHYYRDINTPVETGKGTNVSSISLTDAHANQILLKVDQGSYNTVYASKVYSYSSSGGVTYSSIADVTSIIQAANLGQGSHTFTVANLPTQEGREHSPGIYGGWSLVIIYAEDVLNGTPRNVSIYGGMDHLVSLNNTTPFTISGFKLPASGPIKSQIAIFSGEGELPYKTDYVEISQNGSNWQLMPTNANTSAANNIFDAVMSGIDRDDIPGHWNNLQRNNVGVDVDRFDLSNIVSSYNRNISQLYLRWYSNNDYIIPSMIAFSTELYKPNICYDYTLAIENYVIPSVGNSIKTSYGGFGSPLTTRVSIKSLEGDFPLVDTNITYRIHDTNQLEYVRDSTRIAPTGTYSYVKPPAGQTVNQVQSGFLMYIGKGAGPGQGGVIDPFETRYFKFDDKMLQGSINTAFDLKLNYTVNYGSGDLELTKIFTADDICKDSTGYYPAWGIFNISSDQASTNANTFGEPYNLYTQVANREFNARIFSYGRDLVSPQEINATIEVEVFNADHFARDTNLSCNNPDSNVTAPVFVDFNKETYVDLTGLKYDFAIRNAGFRVWYLSDASGAFVNFKCQNQTDESCFRTVYANYYSGDTYCDGINDMQPENCSSSGHGCYSCLRKYYGKPICSRDNFSIRPEAFVTSILDSNQSNNKNDPSNLISYSKTPTIQTGITNTANLVSGYEYRYDVNATNYQNDLATKGYVQTFSPTSQNAVAKMAWSPYGNNVSGCNDTQDLNITVTVFNGTSILDPDTSIDKIEQVGIYDFALYDSNWTSVDWSFMPHHNASGFASGSDCILDDSIVRSATASGQQGCLTSSVHNHPNGTDVYKVTKIQFYPYSFDISGLSFTAGPAGNSIVYMNTLDDESNYPFGYADRTDENMSYNIQGTFFATSYDDQPLTNYVKNCYADTTDMTLNHIFLSPEIKTMTAELRDYNTTNPSTVIYPDPVTDGTYAERITTLSTATGQFVKTPLTVTQSSNNFEKTMNGAITMDLAFNFDRNIDTPVNPIYIQFTDFNITDKDAPNLPVELKTDKKVFKDKQLTDENITFVYGRIKSSKYFYDNITTNSIVTPVSVVIYCDLGLNQCQNRGLANAVNGLLSGALSNELYWWYAQKHTAADGIVSLSASGGGTVQPANPNNLTFTNGIDNTVTVTNTSGTTPNTVNIDLGSNSSRWLLYNGSSNTIPSPFYKVRFIGTSGWTGEGQTGHVVGDDINTKKSKRVEW